LKLPLVNSKPVLHRPIETAPVIGMYGPPPCRKRKVRLAGKVCAYVYGLVGVFDDSGPGWNALRSDPI
jgi:hypothetical protein